VTNVTRSALSLRVGLFQRDDGYQDHANDWSDCIRVAVQKGRDGSHGSGDKCVGHLVRLLVVVPQFSALWLSKRNPPLHHQQPQVFGGRALLVYENDRLRTPLRIMSKI
jgi:hypothetical protein